MHIAVCLKHVPDPATVEVDPISGTIDTNRLLTTTNPADEVALELALRQCAEVGSVTALTVGAPASEAVLRNALAVGAHHAVRVWDDIPTPPTPTTIAMLLAAALRVAGDLPDMVLCGARSVERGSGQVPALLAEYLGWPIVTDVTSLELDTTASSTSARVQQRLERGAREEFAVALPAVLAFEAGLVRLRHAALPGLLAAQRAAIPTRTLHDMSIARADLRAAAPVVRAISAPRPRPRATFIPDSSLPPHERIEQILTAGVTRQAGQLLEGAPDEMADAIMAFLREKGFLEPVA